MMVTAAGISNLWEVETGVMFGNPGETLGVASVAFSPDGTKILTGHVDNKAILTSAVTMSVPYLHGARQYGPFRGVLPRRHKNPDGRRGEFKLWDEPARTLLLTVPAFTGGRMLNAAALSPTARKC